MCARTGAWTFNYKKILVKKNILWKSKGSVGIKRDFNYSIKDKVVNTLNTWDNLKKGHKVEGREICSFIQLINKKFLLMVVEHIKYSFSSNNLSLPNKSLRKIVNISGEDAQLRMGR